MNQTSRVACLAFLFFSPLVVFTQNPDYTVKELDGGVGEPLGINERGQIVGYSGDPRGGNSAARWDDGTLTRLATPPPSINVAFDINNRGQVVGVSGGRAILWEDGTMSEVDAHGGARGINERGQIVGSGVTGIGDEVHAILWDKGTRVDLGVLPGDSRSAALAINNSGQIIGTSSTQLTQRPFIWDKGTMSELPGIEGQEHGAFDINNRGQVVGYSGARPVVWEKNIPIPLDGLPPLTAGRALGINDNGDIVGYLGSGASSSSVPVLWRNGKPVSLPMLPPHPNFPNSYTATDIANSGTIIGQHQISGFPLPLFWVRNAQPTK
jgi:probable HAF family extracellular repeat protein